MKVWIIFTLSVILQLSKCQVEVPLTTCSIDIRTQLNKTLTGSIKEPIFLKYTGNGFEFLIPDELGTLNFNTGEDFVLLCDGKTNLLTFNSKPNATATCVSDNAFSIDGSLRYVSEFGECNSQIYGNTFNTNIACGLYGVGTLITIGYQVPGGFVGLIDVCYNKAKSSSIYTRHIVQGRAIKNAMKCSARPWSFKTTEVPANIDAATLYTKVSQQQRLENIFGNAVKAAEIMNSTYLARGHLAPDGDFLYVSWQFTTYYYINVVPQWQAVNNGNWKVVENSVRTKADLLKDDLVVYTGGHEVLKLNNFDITLSPDGIEVPKWSWKIIKHVSSNSGIAFVTLNNPFETATPQNLCQDICDSTKWSWTGMKTLSKGYTICCNVNDLMQQIPSIPSEARVANLLEK